LLHKNKTLALHAIGNYGITPLLATSIANQPYMVQLILQKSAKSDQTSMQNVVTPLLIAAELGR